MQGREFLPWVKFVPLSSVISYLIIFSPLADCPLISIQASAQELDHCCRQRQEEVNGLAISQLSAALPLVVLLSSWAPRNLLRDVMALLRTK